MTERHGEAQIGLDMQTQLTAYNHLHYVQRLALVEEAAASDFARRMHAESEAASPS